MIKEWSKHLDYSPLNFTVRIASVSMRTDLIIDAVHHEPGFKDYELGFSHPTSLVVDSAPNVRLWNTPDMALT